jgi:hypothetical protein
MIVASSTGAPEFQTRTPEPISCTLFTREDQLVATADVLVSTVEHCNHSHSWNDWLMGGCIRLESASVSLDWLQTEWAGGEVMALGALSRRWQNVFQNLLCGQCTTYGQSVHFLLG